MVGVKGKVTNAWEAKGIFLGVGNTWGRPQRQPSLCRQLRFLPLQVSDGAVPMGGSPAFLESIFHSGSMCMYSLLR